MKPVMQTKFGDPDGNCFPACLASILELPIEAVPHFPSDSHWFQKTNEWLHGYGLALMTIMVHPDEEPNDVEWPVGCYIASGDGPRGIRHSVVYHTGKLAHDPHPEGGGLVRETEYEILVMLQPAMWVRYQREQRGE